MVKVEQAEFWADLGGGGRSKRGSSTGPTAVEDYLSEPPERESRGRSRSEEEVSEGGDWYDDVAAGSGVEDEPLVMAEPVDAIERRLEAERVGPDRILTSGPAPEWSGAQRSQRFNMARFLTLTGSLDTVEDVGRWMELPKRGFFRSVLSLGRGRRFSGDFLKDIHAPPRAHRGVHRRGC